MAEETVFPSDWTGLKGFDPLMEDLPDMVQAEAFTPSQTALFTVVDTRLGERVTVMEDGGVFGGKSKRNVSKDAAAVAMAEFVDIADGFYRGLAVDSDAYDEWVVGRDLSDLLSMFSLLHRYYVERLGKSSASKRRSKTVA